MKRLDQDDPPVSIKNIPATRLISRPAPRALRTRCRTRSFSRFVTSCDRQSSLQIRARGGRRWWWRRRSTASEALARRARSKVPRRLWTLTTMWTSARGVDERARLLRRALAHIVLDRGAASSSSACAAIHSVHRRCR
jgi:hypothetical protein